MNNINIGGTEEDWKNYWIARQLDHDQQELFKDINKDFKSKPVADNVNLLDKSKKHLKDSNMNYWYHFKHSANNGNKLIWLALSSYAHAILPGKLRQHAARGIITMYEGMKQWPHLRKAMYEESIKVKKNGD